jgi:hypothetical protein
MKYANMYLAAAVIFISTHTYAKAPQPEKKLVAQKKLVFLDGIDVVFRGSDNSTDLIIHSEVERAKLDGSPNSLKDMVNDLALAQEAKKYRLWPSPEEVDKQLRMISDSNNKTPKEFDDLLITIGYSPAEGRNAFAQINAINSLIGFKITGNLIVPEIDVIAYYNDHPEFESAAYYLEYVIVPFASAQTKQQQLKQLKTLIVANDPKHSLHWSSPFWVKQNELAADKQFLTDLQRGEISMPLETEHGFELYRLIDKKEGRARTLDERYNDIVNILRKPKYTELLTNFQKDLLDNASIIYFNLPK